MAVVARRRSAPALSTATCASDVLVGDSVTLRKSGGAYTALPVDAGVTTGEAPSGVVESKPTSTTCVVRTDGEAAIYSGLVPGKTYFVGLDRRPTNPPPVASGPHPLVYIQPVGFAISSDTLVVRAGDTVAAVVA